MAEDVSSGWDSWDIDADCQMKFRACSQLFEREIVSDGNVQFRIRSIYRLSEKSTLKQDMIFYSTTPRVDFETVMDWKDKHRFLKVDFDTTIMSNTARHEIQFGHCQKPTTRNNSYEQAMFEVVNHKFTDISETRFGIAILNDCKYGISVEGADIRLSLHKGGTRPDPRGDSGVHECTYSFLPHVGSFSSENVIIPAYCLNYRPVVKIGRALYSSFASVDCTNIVIETVKPCEENCKAYIMRLYEAEGTYAAATVTLGHEPKSVELTNMLEERVETLAAQSRLSLTFRPFEIKTVKVSY
ncbi:MAG: alpha-mannosidase [Eubacterium sp.]|nr:alpha-mannosidase [Eubacterium sp.]